MTNDPDTKPTTFHSESVRSEPVRGNGEGRLNVSGAFDGFLFDLQSLIQDYSHLAKLEARKFSQMLAKALGAVVLGVVFGGNGLADLVRALSGFMVRADVVSNFQALLLSSIIQLILCGVLLWYAVRMLAQKTPAEAKSDVQKLKGPVGPLRH